MNIKYINRIKQLLNENFYIKIFYNKKGKRPSMIVNLKDYSFKEIFVLFANYCGLGEKYKEYDFILNNEYKEYLKKIYQDYINENNITKKKDIFNFYEEETNKIFDILKYSDYNLKNSYKYKIEKIILHNKLKLEKQNDLIIIDSSIPEKYKYKDFLVYDITEDCLWIADYHEIKQ